MVTITLSEPIKLRGNMNLTELKEKVKAFRALFGRDPQISLGGVYNTSKWETMWLTRCYERVVSIGHKYVQVMDNDEKVSLTLPAEEAQVVIFS